VATFNESLVDASTEYTLDLNRVGNTVARQDILPLLLRLEEDLIGKLASSGVAGGAVDKVRSLLAWVKDAINEVYARMEGITGETLAGIAETESLFWKKAINGGVGIEILTSLPTVKQLEVLARKVLIAGAVNEEWWNRQARELRQRFEDQLRMGIALGETNDDIIRRVRGRRENGFKDGIMRVSRKDADALVRTGIQTVSNKVRTEIFDANKDIFKGYKQVSTLDTRTSPICIAYSGKRWDERFRPIGHKLPYNGGTPRHWRCRSFIVPIVKSWKELGINLDEAPMGTRSSMTGQVPADTTFNDFLKGRTKAEQDEILGKGVATLWRGGKIGLAQLVDSSGTRALTLGELRQKLVK